MKRIAGLALFALAMATTPLQAQDKQTLADIRQELTILNVEIQKLKRELSTTGSPSVQLGGNTVLDRVTVMEEALQRVTARTEQLENRVNQVVIDGTNRIGDLEFRLVELEGGDVSKLGETSTLGGVPVTGAATPAPATPSTPSTELAVGEEADLKAAKAALAAGDNARAASLLASFSATYPGSPLAAEAEMSRGLALEGLGDTREAARAYLASFNAETTGPHAPDALLRLGTALGRLGQTQQACITLGEVAARFPTAPAVAQSQTEMRKLGCS